ncbi:hypothetical protein [uncultured Paraglaciecola sp.]|uniref:hypothetical protein n=1 Tax=uncultured Paraglaciecola sp. TaxID=1765024 RepID=UPI0030D6D25B|tara:strand:- start:29479 stop:29649 length:171 start_codon:yes stop_codon:yes gene_type:complete
MLLVSLLVISLVLLFIFSMSKEKGKNTKFARKGANAIPPKKESSQPISASEVIEIN